MKQILIPCWLLLTCPITSATEPPITAIAFEPGGETLVTTSQNGLQQWSWPALKPGRVIDVSAVNPHCVAFSPDGNRLAVGGGTPSEDGTIEVFSWPEGMPVEVWTDHGDSVRAIRWIDSQRLISASVDREIKLWESGSHLCQKTFSGHSRSANAICFLKETDQLVSAGSDQSVRVWALDAGDPVRSLIQHTKPVVSLAVRPSHSGLPMIASASADRTIRFWQPTIGRMVRYIRLAAEPLEIDWLPDGERLVASCSDGLVRVINADRVEVTQAMPAIAGWAYAIKVHPTDGTLAVGGSEGQLKRLVFR